MCKTCTNRKHKGKSPCYKHMTDADFNIQATAMGACNFQAAKQALEATKALDASTIHFTKLTSSECCDIWVTKEQQEQIQQIADKQSAQEITMSFYDDDEEYVNNEMSQASADTKKTNYLLSRLEGIYSEKDTDLHRQFGLLDDKTPVTAKDLIERITTGKYVLKNEDNRYAYNAMQHFSWRDPSVKKDQEGYEAASKKLYDVYQKAKDQIVVNYPDMALNVLHEFEKLAVH